MKFTNEQWQKLYEEVVKNNIELIKWLYDNHKTILREYEATRGKLRIEFLSKDKSTIKNKKGRNKQNEREDN